jgi:hypothetical protein
MRFVVPVGRWRLADIADAAKRSKSNVTNRLKLLIDSAAVRKAAFGLYEVAPPPARPWSNSVHRPQ